jgi:hypothetical protein
MTPNSVTTTYANDFILSIYGDPSTTAATFTANASTTARVNSGSTGSIAGLLIADELQAAAGASTARAATSSASVSWSAIAIGLIPTRTVYWVGGTATWAAATTPATGTMWADSSGGAGGKIAPGSGDAVVVDANSGSPTITPSNSSSCGSLTTTGATCTFAGGTSGATGLYVFGDFILSATTTWSNVSSLLIGTRGTFNTNGVTIASGINFFGASSTTTLAGNLTSTAQTILTSGILTLGTFNITVPSFYCAGSGVRTINFGTGVINCNGNATTVWDSSSAGNFTTTGTPTINFTYSGSVGTRVIATNQGGGSAITNANIDLNITAGSDIITFNAECRNLNFTGFTGSWTPVASSSTQYYIAGNLIIPSGMTLGSSVNFFNFRGTTAGNTINTNGKQLQSINIAGVGGAWTLGSALNLASSITLTDGSFDSNGFSVTATSLSSGGATTRVLSMGASTWTLTGTGTVWNLNSTGLTLTAGTSNILLSDTSTVARTFSSTGVVTYNTVTIGGATGISTTTFAGGSSTITTLASTKTVAHTISFSANYTIGNWTVNGTSGNSVTVISSVAATQRVLTYTGSTRISMSFMIIQDINFSYTLGAANPYLVYAPNSTNLGNNSGIAFISSAQTAYILTGGTSWTTPSDWNNSNNSISLIGGGGAGGAASASGSQRAGGGGGGGGGYNLLSNQTLSGTISYTIGAGGFVGSGGGSTSFNSSGTAGGGSAGNSVGGTVSIVGTGGSGLNTGGAGGLGSVVNSATGACGGGGGGGAAGPSGTGGAGGAGFGNSGGSNAGGGGGGNGGGTAGGAASGLGGIGGNNFLGSGGSSTTGTNGGGGGGGAGNFRGYSGGPGIDISSTIGGGGGTGGAGGNAIAITNTGLYGSGGSGTGVSSAGSLGTAGSGGAGVIFIVYTPAVAVTTGNFFSLFNVT